MAYDFNVLLYCMCYCFIWNVKKSIGRSVLSDLSGRLGDQGCVGFIERPEEISIFFFGLELFRQHGNSLFLGGLEKLAHKAVCSLSFIWEGFFNNGVVFFFQFLIFFIQLTSPIYIFYRDSQFPLILKIFSIEIYIVSS